MRRPLSSHVRAGLILFALLGHGAYAIPLPPRVTPADVAGKAADEIGMWQRTLSAAGIPVSKEQLGDWLVSLTGVTSRVHGWMKAPFRPMFSLVGANQAWALFASATVRPERLVVEVKERGQVRWTPLLRRGDPCCTWREDQMRYRRIRGIWDSQFDGARPAYVGLTRWVAARAFEERPEVEQVRVFIERGHSTYPWEPVDPKVTQVHLRVMRRNEIAPVR